MESTILTLQLHKNLIFRSDLAPEVQLCSTAPSAHSRLFFFLSLLLTTLYPLR